VTCDGRLFHRQAAATGNALSPTVDRRVHRTSRDVDEAERSRRLDSVSAGRRSHQVLSGQVIGDGTTRKFYGGPNPSLHLSSVPLGM